MEITKVGLADAIESLRSELSEAFNNKPQTGIVFGVQSVELELQVIAETNAKGEISGGWSLLGWNMGGKVEGGESLSGIHTVKLALEAKIIRKDGGSSIVEISSENTDPR